MMASKKTKPSERLETTELRIEKSASFLKSDWPMIICVAMVVCIIVYSVLNHARHKPDTPQAMFANAIKQVQGLPEWKPGLGAQPLLSKPAAFARSPWQTLYTCPTHGPQTPVFDSNAAPYCPICNQNMMVSQ
ncbi:Magnetosome protein MamI-3 [Candidatus Desulfarcum epimagneticum]|uniref:Magnetosome protein MamI-3 n=1 Tax=uncultured Desulfobacteraceae bacterium TaxID=218296 RepID=A0A484HFX4_9BACT|nr:Magnetosome protein MamI-3 [uncultured Desulfobacteraceae bacterium]